MSFYKFPKILFIGPDYRNHRGGIGATLSIYSKYINSFNLIVSYRPGNNLMKIKIAFRGFLFLIKVLLFDKIQIVHIHGSHGASVYRKFLFFITSKYIFNKKVIYHIHSSSFDVYYNNGSMLYRYLCKKIIKSADMVIVLSNSWEAYLLSDFKTRKVSILNNVIEPTRNQKIYNYESKHLKILFLGRVGQRKGIFDILNVLSEFRDQLSGQIELFIGGDGDIDLLKKRIVEHKLSTFVHFVGWISDDKKEQYLAMADVLILPSYNEGLPISILEGMNYGLPIIASNVGGIPEVVYHMQNGYLIEKGDLNALYSAIRFYIDNREFLEIHGRESRKKIKEYYPEYVFPKLEMIYNNVLTQQSEK